MSDIIKIADSGIEEMLLEFENLGGVIDFNFFRMSSTLDEKEAHLFAAKTTLQELKNQNTYFKVSINLDIGDSGQRITPETFFGTHFNYQEQKPVLREKIGKPLLGTIVRKDYYYFDSKETDDNIVQPELHSAATFYNSNYYIKGYAGAFLEPPHSFGGGGSSLEIGSYFIDFNRKILDEFDKLIIYAWSVDCSNYFDAGKEWWGSFFWTVYNPVQNIYIGITASTTD